MSCGAPLSDNASSSSCCSAAEGHIVRLRAARVSVWSPMERTQSLLHSHGQQGLHLVKATRAEARCLNYEGTNTRADAEENITVKEFEGTAFKRIGVARRSLREIAMMAHFRNHPNVIGLRDFLCLPQECVLIAITERLDYDLESVLKSSFLFEEKQITCITFQLLFALLYIHRAGVVHGNITPANIQLSVSCDLKLGGFCGAHGNDVGEEPSEYVGSRLWKAPEQVMCEEELSFAVDIWAVGCILAQIYHRSTAGLSPQYKPLFSGLTHVDHLEQIVDLRGTPSEDQVRSVEAKEYIQKNLSGRPGKDLSTVLHNPDGTAIPKEVVELLDRMLQFSPTKRPTVEEAVQHPFFSEHYDPEDLQVPRDTFRELDDLEVAAEAKATAECGAASPLGSDAKKERLVVLHFITALTDELREGLEYCPPEEAVPAAPSTHSLSSSDLSGETAENHEFTGVAFVPEKSTIDFRDLTDRASELLPRALLERIPSWEPPMYSGRRL